MASDIFFIAHSIVGNHLDKTTRNKSTLPPTGTYKTFFETSTLQKPLSLHHNQIKRVKNKVDGKLSTFLFYMEASDYKAAFTLMHLVFL